MSDLKPCPFCGGEAKIKSRYYRAIDIYDYSGVCQECNASMDVKDTEAEAIEAWNTRRERTCKRESYFNGYNLTHVCTDCGYLSEYQWNYCPNCGAKVVG